MKPALCSLPARWVDPAENARALAPRGLLRVTTHYNKPAARAAGRNVLTIHWRGKCLLVNHLLCNVKLESHEQKRQPHCVLRGFAREVKVFEGCGKWKGGTVGTIV